MSGERISKLERLLNLTAMLLETRRPLTVDEIGDKMMGYPDDPDSFRRQFERDKDELRAAGVPLEVSNPDASDRSEFAYRIPPEQYYLPDPGFTEDETAAVWLAIHSIELDDDAGTEALRKFGIDGIDTADPVGEAPVANVSAPEGVAALRQGIAESRVATFSYRGEQRALQPHRLSYLNGNWYVTGLDQARDESRTFRVDRIEGAVALGDPAAFAPPSSVAGLSIEPWRFGPDEPTAVTVAIDADHVDLVRHRFGRDASWVEHDDGSAEVTCTVRGRQAFRTLMFSMLDHAVITAPAEMREWFVASLEEVAR